MCSVAKLERENRWNVLQVKVQERNVCEAFRCFRENGVEPILIKGIASARWYPEEVGRAAVDVDLCVRADQFEQCKEMLMSDPPDRVTIDLHNGFRYLDPMPWEYMYDNTDLVDIEGTKIRILSPEDHLRVLCTHWLTDGGENKDRLWDIFYAIDRRPRNFEWDKCLGCVPRHRQLWVIYTIGLAHHYFGLDLSALPFEKKSKTVPKWIRREVEKNWETGVPIAPLSSCKHDRKALWQQIKKRFPPNPIFATVSMDGTLDSLTRMHYQAGNFFMRAILAARGVNRHFLGFKRK